MFDWPIGIANVIMFIGWLFILVSGRLKGVAYSTKNWRLITLLFTVAIASLFVVIVLQVTNETDKASAALRTDHLENIYSLFVLIFCGLSHQNFRFDRGLLEFELAPLEVVTVLLAVQVVAFHHLIVMMLSLPTLFLICASSHTIMQRQFRIGFESSRFIFLTALLFLLFAFGSALLYRATGSLVVDEVFKAHVLTADKPAFFVGWAMIVLGNLAMLPIAPIGFLTRSFKRASIWSLVGYFYFLPLLVGTLFLQRWLVLLENSPSWIERFTSADNIVSSPPLATLVGLAVLVWCALTLILSRGVLEVVTSLFLQLIAFFFLSTSLNTRGAQGWSIITLCLFVFAVPSAIKMLMDTQCTVAGRLKDLAEQLAKCTSESRLLVFFSLLFVFPLASNSGFNILHSLVAEWMSTPFDQATQTQVFLASSMIFFSLLVSGLGMWYLSNLLTPFSAQSSRSLPSSLLDRTWNFILLVPVIIVGIYPAALYKYVLKYLGN